MLDNKDLRKSMLPIPTSKEAENSLVFKRREALRKTDPSILRIKYQEQ
jgi:hypothetical protein